VKQGGVHQRRTRFVKEYLLEQNATKAAIAAGYSEKTAGQQGHRLLKDAQIRAEIEQKNTEINQKLDLSVERIKLEIARLCYYDPAAFFKPDGSPKAIADIDEDSRRAMVGFETAELFEGSGEKRDLAGYIKKFKLSDKGRALELAARVQKMLVDRVEVTASDELVKRLVEGRKRARVA
jgi:phage terminase small subunit